MQTMNTLNMCVQQWFLAPGLLPTLLVVRRPDVRLEQVEFQSTGARGVLHSPWGKTEVFSPLPGVFNLSNLAAAVAALAVSGADLQAIVEAVSSLCPVPGRMQVIPQYTQFSGDRGLRPHSGCVRAGVERAQTSRHRIARHCVWLWW